MLDLYEQLSRLMDGDLSAEDAAALRHRIDAEPNVRAAWQAMQQLGDDLSALPEQLPHPPALVSSIPTPANRTAWWPLAVAAAALLVAGGLWVRPAPVTELALGYGVQAIDGDAVLHVMGVDVAISGRAAISVEPPGDLPRVSLSEDPMNALTHIGAVAAGALITVAVYEGTAAITEPDGSSFVVHPDAPVTIRAGGSATPAPSGAQTRTDVAPSQTGAGTSVEALQQRIAELEVENEGLAMVAALAQGQLAVVAGEPVEWPETVPSYQEPDWFETAVMEATAQIPGASIIDIDCTEYPCIAHIDLDPTEVEGVRDWDEYIHPIGEALTNGEEDVGVMAMVNQSDSETGSTATLSMAIPDEQEDGPANQRVESRVQEFYQEQDDAL